MPVYVCLLVSMLYIHVCLSRSTLCHALCPPWACSYRSLRPLAFVVTSVLHRACLDVTTCEIHLRGVGVLGTHLSSLCTMLLCLPCLLWVTHLASFASLLLCFFASLHACLHVHAWVRVLSILQSNGTMDTQSKPTFVLLGHPLLFDNVFVCLFECFTCLFAPLWHLLLVCLLACFSFYLFLCLSAVDTVRLNLINHLVGFISCQICL